MLEDTRYQCSGMLRGSKYQRQHSSSLLVHRAGRIIRLSVCPYLVWRERIGETFLLQLEAFVL